VKQARSTPIRDLSLLAKLGEISDFVGYSALSFAVVTVLALLTTLTEGVGIALVYPIIEVMQSGAPAVDLAQKSGVFRAIAYSFDLFGLPLTFGALVAVAAGLIVVRQVLNYVSVLVRARLNQQAVEHIATETFRSVAHADLNYVEKLRSGSFVNALIMEAKRAGMLATAVQNLISAGCRIVVYVGLLAFVSWQATVVGLGLLFVVGYVVSSGMIRDSRSTGQRLYEANDHFARRAAERLGLLRLIKAAGTEGDEVIAFRRRNADLRELNIVMARYAARIDAFIEGVVVLGGLALVYTAFSVLELRLSVLGVFLIVILRLMPIAREIAVNYQHVAACSASLNYLDDLLLTARAARERDSGSKPFPGLTRAIRLDRVSFEYPAAEGATGPVPALHDISLTIPAGQTTALLGPSGAGKSTLMDLIPRLRQPTQGRILFDDVPIDEIRLAELRRNVAFVSQDALVLDGTIEENLRYGHPDADKEALVAAARDAYAHDFILRLPLGYDTMVGERGVLLSGGQKQRLALARALVGRATILLLDEPTSALDAESELAVQQALARLQASRAMTIVIIAHRLSTVRHADHIIVLEEGRLLGSGTHDELMTSAPWYRRIVRLQLGETADTPAPRTAAGAP
jgi:subfamily B ATP-binding cassette protein MsbA